MFFDWNMNGTHDSSDDLMSFAFFNSMEDEERRKREEEEKKESESKNELIKAGFSDYEGVILCTN